MNSQSLMERSKNREKIDFNSIGCDDLSHPLVVVVTTTLLKVEPIWENPIDDLEGPLYQNYIKLHPKYDSVYVRQTVSEMLSKAATKLPKYWQLILRAGHRPVDVQKKLLQGLVDEYQEAHPDATNLQALEFARTYVSDPEVKLPPHCCGAAVDVDVADRRSGQLLDFGCPMNTDSETAFLHSLQISKKQYENRMILLKAMLMAGFASCYSEWWHFSYGDQIWAHFYKQPRALYGLIEPEL